MSEEDPSIDETPGDGDADEAPVTSLDDVTTGRWIVTTIHGTRHYLDLDNGTIVREPGPQSQAWPAEGVGLGPVTPDGTPMRFLSIETAVVGRRMLVQNAHQWRISSEIVKIERAPE